MGRGSSDADVQTVCCKKKQQQIFRKLWFVHTNKEEGFEEVRIFFGQKNGVKGPGGSFL